MNIDFFREQIIKMRSVFTEAVFSKDRANLLWLEFKDIPNHIFEKVCQKFKDDHGTNPEATGFENYLKETLSAEVDLAQEEHHKDVNQIYKPQVFKAPPPTGAISKRYCCDFGKVLVTRKVDGLPFVFKCSCDFGKKMSVNLIEWTGQLDYEKVD